MYVSFVTESMIYPMRICLRVELDVTPALFYIYLICRRHFGFTVETGTKQRKCSISKVSSIRCVEKLANITFRT